MSGLECPARRGPEQAPVIVSRLAPAGALHAAPNDQRRSRTLFVLSVAPRTVGIGRFLFTGQRDFASAVAHAPCRVTAVHGRRRRVEVVHG